MTMTIGVGNAGADVAVPHCVMAQDPSVTYDLNSWRETEHSRKKVNALPKLLPIFEGYDDYVDPRSVCACV